MNVEQTASKRSYDQPTFVRLGAFSALTQAMMMGPYADMLGGIMDTQMQ
jgi:hypothetical protein